LLLLLGLLLGWRRLPGVGRGGRLGHLAAACCLCHWAAPLLLLPSLCHLDIHKTKVVYKHYTL
jgi:hypothetical protein